MEKLPWTKSEIKENMEDQTRVKNKTNELASMIKVYKEYKQLHLTKTQSPPWTSFENVNSLQPEVKQDNVLSQPKENFKESKQNVDDLKIVDNKGKVMPRTTVKHVDIKNKIFDNNEHNDKEMKSKNEKFVKTVDLVNTSTSMNYTSGSRFDIVPWDHLPLPPLKNNNRIPTTGHDVRRKINSNHSSRSLELNNQNFLNNSKINKPKILFPPQEIVFKSVDTSWAEVLDKNKGAHVVAHQDTLPGWNISSKPEEKTIKTFPGKYINSKYEEKAIKTLPGKNISLKHEEKSIKTFPGRNISPKHEVTTIRSFPKTEPSYNIHYECINRKTRHETLANQLFNKSKAIRSIQVQQLQDHMHDKFIKKISKSPINKSRINRAETPLFLGNKFRIIEEKTPWSPKALYNNSTIKSLRIPYSSWDRNNNNKSKSKPFRIPVPQNKILNESRKNILKYENSRNIRTPISTPRKRMYSKSKTINKSHKKIPSKPIRKVYQNLKYRDRTYRDKVLSKSVVKKEEQTQKQSPKLIIMGKTSNTHFNCNSGDENDIITFKSACERFGEQFSKTNTAWYKLVPNSKNFTHNRPPHLQRPRTVVGLHRIKNLKKVRCIQVEPKRINPPTGILDRVKGLPDISCSPDSQQELIITKPITKPIVSKKGFFKRLFSDKKSEHTLPTTTTTNLEPSTPKKGIFGWGHSLWQRVKNFKIKSNRINQA